MTEESKIRSNLWASCWLQVVNLTITTSVWLGFIMWKNRPRVDRKPHWPENELLSPWTYTVLNFWWTGLFVLKLPDGKCLFLSLSGMKTWSLSLNTVSRMLRCTLDCCCYFFRYWCQADILWLFAPLSGCQVTREQENPPNVNAHTQSLLRSFTKTPMFIL